MSEHAITFAETKKFDETWKIVYSPANAHLLQDIRNELVQRSKKMCVLRMESHGRISLPERFLFRAFFVEEEDELFKEVGVPVEGSSTIPEDKFYIAIQFPVSSSRYESDARELQMC